MVWCVRGSGRLTVNGERFELTPGALLLLPWRHSVQYEPDPRDPFLVGAVHLVPVHDGGPIIRRAGHNVDPLTFAPGRLTDTDLEWLPRAGELHFGVERAVTLGGYAIAVFENGAPDARLRSLAELLFYEVELMCTTGVGVPPQLRRLQDQIRERLRDPLTLENVCELADASKATVERLFVKNLGVSVQAWIRSERMRQAVTLFSSTGARVNEVAAEVGFTDPLYFSRVFRKTYGRSPKEFRQGLTRP